MTDRKDRRCFLRKRRKECYNQGRQNAALRGRQKFAPTYLSVKRVDTTGAGDSFCAGFLAGIAQGKSFEESAKLGNAVGSHCIMAMGASTGIKPLADIYKFMEEHTDEVPFKLTLGSR